MNIFVKNWSHFGLTFLSTFLYILKGIHPLEPGDKSPINKKTLNHQSIGPPTWLLASINISFFSWK